jgi:hypothetical protein
VTASTRLNVWLMAKALGKVLTIIDGGPYELMKVNYFKTQKKHF